MIQRRHVFYVEGYDPQGAAGYYRIFQHTAKRFRKIWPFQLDVGRLEIDNEFLAHWDIAASGPNWRVATRYELLRLEGVVTGNMSQPLWRQIAHALHWITDDILSGTTFRIAKASWRFAVHLVFFQLLLLTWIAASLAGGVFAAVLAARLAGLPWLASLPIAVAAAAALFVLLRPLADRWFVLQINSCWPHLREFARSDRSAFDHPIDVFAKQVVAAARAGEADEIVIIGHSGGGVLAPAVLARALDLAPDLGRCWPRIVLLTLGSIMPAAALHPRAGRLRAIIARLVVEPSILWIDCQSRTDWLNFWGFDPVTGLGLNVAAERRNPRIWWVRFRDMLTPRSHARLRWNLFRMHYQFIMANDNRARYDYLMLNCSPAPVEAWAQDDWQLVRSFTEDGSFLDARATPFQPAAPAARAAPVASRHARA